MRVSQGRVNAKRERHRRTRVCYPKAATGNIKHRRGCVQECQASRAAVTCPR